MSDPASRSLASRPLEEKKDRGVALALFLIFAAALAFRLWGIFNPLLDFHAWRQTLTAMVARNFYRDGMNLFAPRLDDLQPYFEFEFQIFPYLVALLYQLFGVREWLGRFVAVLFGLGTLGYLYGLGRRLLDRRAALVAAALFAVLPMAVYYNRAFMPESSMLFFSVAGLYHFDKWLGEARGRDFWLAAGGVCGAVLVKLPALYLFLPLAFLAWEKLSWRAFRSFRIWLFPLLVLIPPVLWYGYTSLLAARAGLEGAGLWLQNDKLFGIEYLGSARFYRLLFLTRLGEKMFAFSVFPLFLAGLFLPVREPRERVLLVWLGAVVLYFFTVAKGNAIHEYYQLPVLPVGCLFAGKAVSAAVRRARARGVPWRRDRLLWAVTLLLLFVPFHSVWKLRDRLETDLSTLRFARKVAAATSAQDRLLVQGSHQTDLLYYADRRGWYLGNQARLHDRRLEAYREKGTRYYVTRLADLRRGNPPLYRYLRRNYPFVEEGRDGIIVDLTRRLNAGGEAGRKG